MTLIGGNVPDLAFTVVYMWHQRYTHGSEFLVNCFHITTCDLQFVRSVCSGFLLLKEMLEGNKIILGFAGASFIHTGGNDKFLLSNESARGENS